MTTRPEYQIADDFQNCPTGGLPELSTGKSPSPVHDRLLSCPDCGGSIVKTQSDLVCMECGIVHDCIYAPGIYQLGESSPAKSTAGKQFVSIGKRVEAVDCLGSHIGRTKDMFFYDSNNRPIPPRAQQTFRRLKKTYDFKIRIKHRETDYRVLNILGAVTSCLDLPKKIQEHAAYLFKKIKQGEEEIKNHVALIAFCLFIAIRKHSRSAPVNIQEIADTFQDFGHRVTPRLILRHGIHFKKYIRDEIQPHTSEDYFPRLLDGVRKIQNLESRLRKKGYELSVARYRQELERTLRELARDFTPKYRRGRNPFILAGAMIYTADKLLARRLNKLPVLTQKLTAQGTGIAEYSIRDHYIAALKPYLTMNKNRVRTSEL